MAQVMSKAKVTPQRQSAAPGDDTKASPSQKKQTTTKATAQARKARPATTDKAQPAKAKAKSKSTAGQSKAAQSKAGQSKAADTTAAGTKAGASKVVRSRSGGSKTTRSPAARSRSAQDGSAQTKSDQRSKAQTTAKATPKATPKPAAKPNGRAANQPLSKTHARLSRRILDEREKLVRQAEELEAEQQALAADPDAAEMSGDMESGDCVASREREVDLRLAAHIDDMIAQIDRATERLDAGTYGQCARCHDRIPAARLEALPYAELCVSCQEKHERLYY